MIGLYSANSQAGVGFTGLLDEYGGAAAAYSVRRLSGSYSGSLIEVRIDTVGQPVYDIGFDSNGDLDTADLISKAAGNDAFVRTWYDQSGNSNDAQQTTTSNQPQIVTSGVIDVLNSIPAIKSFNNAWLLTSSNPVSDGYISVFAITQVAATSAANPIVDLTTSTSFSISTGVRLDRNFTKRWGTDNTFLTALGDTDLNLFTGIRGVSDRFFRIDGTQVGTSSVTGTQSFAGVANLVVGAYHNESLSADQYFQEHIIYNSDQSSNASNIESNINTYFSIY